VPQTTNTKTANFADDTAVMTVGENIEEAINCGKPLTQLTPAPSRGASY
jgi:hypothetical protein